MSVSSVAGTVTRCSRCLALPRDRPILTRAVARRAFTDYPSFNVRPGRAFQLEPPVGRWHRRLAPGLETARRDMHPTGRSGNIMCRTHAASASISSLGSGRRSVSAAGELASTHTDLRSGRTTSSMRSMSAPISPTSLRYRRCVTAPRSSLLLHREAACRTTCHGGGLSLRTWKQSLFQSSALRVSRRRC
jgi:hypothetical protein